MSTRLILATANGVVVLGKNGKTWQENSSAYHGQRFTAVASQGETILAGTPDGLYRSADGGQTWHAASEGLVYKHIRSLALHPEDVRLAFAGTEPAAIHYSLDGGQTWRYCPEVADLRDRYRWYLPYSPRAGCIRGFALANERAYAAVEQGGLLRSDDSGRTWRLMDPSEDPRLETPDAPWIHKDVHSVQVHTSSEDTVFAPTGGGFYYSTNGGQGWTQLHPNYCRALWADPLRADHLVLGPANGPDRGGWIVETLNGGASWTRRMSGLEEFWKSTMVEEFHPVDDTLIALLSDGRLLSAPLETLQWQPMLEGYTEVRAASLLRN